jgi:hypothetical protein
MVTLNPVQHRILVSATEELHWVDPAVARFFLHFTPIKPSDYTWLVAGNAFDVLSITIVGSDSITANPEAQGLLREMVGQVSDGNLSKLVGLVDALDGWICLRLPHGVWSNRHGFSNYWVFWDTLDLPTLSACALIRQELKRREDLLRDDALKTTDNDTLLGPPETTKLFDRVRGFEF